ncbi:241_t:CDS:2, partial [Cetraspora pellucida]
SKPPLRNIEKNNNLFEDDSQVMNVEITENKRKKILNRTNVKKKKENKEPCSHSCSHISKNIQPQSEQASNALSSSIRSPSPENFYDQCSLTSKISQSPLAERHSPKSSSALTTSNTINISSSFLIGLFKSDLEVCLHLVQHLALINLVLSMINADAQES